MIAPARRVHRQKSRPAWQTAFEAMLPAIRAQARFAFRKLAPDAKADAIEEVLANCYCAYARLVERGMEHVANPSALVRYAVRQFREGRRVGNRLNIREVLSPYAQHKRHLTVERLDRFDDDTQAWQEAVVQDTRKSPVPEIVAFRVDFAHWLKSLGRRDRRIAESLALGNRTSDVAQKYRVSAGRISQLRREFAQSWRTFTGEGESSTAQAATVPA